MPTHIVEKLNTIFRSENRLRAELGHEPSSFEIALDVELSPDEVDQIRRSSEAPLSLEKPVGDDEQSALGHFLADETEPLPDEVAEVEMQKAKLRLMLGTLSGRQRRVLELRYGLAGEPPRTLEEIAPAFNVSRERIRQIEKDGLDELKMLATSQKLDRDL
jgi:RNA polymerase primary sigma factor